MDFYQFCSYFSQTFELPEKELSFIAIFIGEHGLRRVWGVHDSTTSHRTGRGIKRSLDEILKSAIEVLSI